MSFQQSLGIALLVKYLQKEPNLQEKMLLQRNTEFQRKLHSIFAEACNSEVSDFHILQFSCLVAVHRSLIVKSINLSSAFCKAV